MKMITKLIAMLVSFVSACIIVLIIYLNYKLYYTPTFTSINGAVVNNDLVKQLHYLKDEMHSGASEKMQQYYPEGFVFTQAVYGLSWAALADNIPHNQLLYNEAINEMDWSYKQICSKKGIGRFDKNLPIPYGAYYAGWRNYLLGKKLFLEDSAIRNTTEINNFKTACTQIGKVIDTTVYPESYPDNSWPADVFIAVSCLSLHDKIFEPEYKQSIDNWLMQVKAHLDKNGFIPYAAERNGIPKEIARGSSEGLILNFLSELDPVFANEQFNLYQKQFIDYRFGLPGIREFPKGIRSIDDVDSGPVILDMGSAATIVGLKVLTDYKDAEHSIPIRNGLEAFGFGYENEYEKKYLFGLWPMADVFLAWSHSSEIQQINTNDSNSNWRITFQLYSVGLIILFAGIILLMRKRKSSST